MKRVDTEKHSIFETGDQFMVFADFAYELEREVDRLRRLLAKANDEIEAERNRIIAASDAAFRYLNRHK